MNVIYVADHILVQEIWRNIKSSWRCKESKTSQDEEKPLIRISHTWNISSINLREGKRQRKKNFTIRINILDQIAYIKFIWQFSGYDIW